MTINRITQLEGERMAPERTAEFTPGPWGWYRCYDPSGKRLVSLDIVPANGHSLTGVAVAASVFGNEANADLIAAAPDLYEALHNLVNAVGSTPTISVDRAHEIALAALTKARGGKA